MIQVKPWTLSDFTYLIQGEYACPPSSPRWAQWLLFWDRPFVTWGLWDPEKNKKRESHKMILWPGLLGLTSGHSHPIDLLVHGSTLNAKKGRILKCLVSLFSVPESQKWMSLRMSQDSLTHENWLHRPHNSIYPLIPVILGISTIPCKTGIFN